MKTYKGSNLSILLVFLLLYGMGQSETIKQDFNSMADLDAFWDKSAWTGTNRTHATQNVTVENGILILKLSGSQPGQKPICAEIASKRNNFKYGSYRASIKTSHTVGAVVGWFIYNDNPLNEIDIEFLTKDNKDIHFTLHHIVENVDYQKKTLDFDPSLAFHEYRFDWYADRVEYFVDSKPYATLKKDVPNLNSQIMLNHWSGNISGWGGVAPTQDMFMYVDYMYYSTDYNFTTSVNPHPEAATKAAVSQNKIARHGNILTVEKKSNVSANSPSIHYSLAGQYLESYFPVQAQKQ